MTNRETQTWSQIWFYACLPHPPFHPSTQASIHPYLAYLSLSFLSPVIVHTHTCFVGLLGGQSLENSSCSPAPSEYLGT